jgi:hypothetical protein
LCLLITINRCRLIQYCLYFSYSAYDKQFDIVSVTILSNCIPGLTEESVPYVCIRIPTWVFSSSYLLLFLYSCFFCLVSFSHILGSFLLVRILAHIFFLTMFMTSCLRPSLLNSSESSTIGWKKKNKATLTIIIYSAHNTHWAFFFFLRTIYVFKILFFFLFFSSFFLIRSFPEKLTRVQWQWLKYWSKSIENVRYSTISTSIIRIIEWNKYSDSNNTNNITNNYFK